MIIVSQDKDKIFNFDNVSLIFIQDNNEIWVDTEKTCNLLGKYHTKERAKEVLRDLLKSMNKQKFLMKPKINLNQKTIEEAFEIIPINKDNTIIYEMPKK